MRPQLKFDPLVVDNGQPRLKLRGITGTNYTIESSANLTNWVFLFAGVATNGQLDFLHSGGGSFRQQFYRALAGTAPMAPAKIEPRANTNATTGALVTFEGGGSCTLLGNAGQRFTLTFPTNTIPDPSIIKMTLVTNIAGLPFSRGIIGAVRLEPENLDIFGAAILDISYPTNIDWRQIVSFTSGNDGSDFHLTPDVVRSNYIRIPITHFGTFGSSLATTQEVAQAVQSESHHQDRVQTIAKLDLTGARGRVAPQDFQHSSLICFSEKVARAVMVFDRLNYLRLTNETSLAVSLSLIRQKVLGGEEIDISDEVKSIVGDQCLIYRAHIARYIPEAADNCAMNTILLKFALGVEQQLQVLGLADDQGTCTGYKNLPLCPGFKVCLNEIEECCKRSNQGRNSIADLTTLKNQQRLLGLDCIKEADIQQALVACTNIEWIGTFTYKDHGQTNQTRVNGTDTYEHILSYDLSFAGSVVDVTETIFVDDVTGALTFFVSLIVSGHFDGYTLDKEVYSTNEKCGTRQLLNSTEEAIDSPGEYRISFIIEPDNTYRITIPQGFGPASHTRTHGATSAAVVDSKGDCAGGYSMIYSDPIKSQSFFAAPPLVFPSFDDFPDTGAALPDTDHVSGTFSMDPRPMILPTRTATYRWDFHRRKKQQ